MLFGIFSRDDSMGEVCDGMPALAGKLNYLGVDSALPKSPAGDALRERDNEIFKLALIKYFESLLSVSRKEKISFEKFYALDSTTITLFSNVMIKVWKAILASDFPLLTSYFPVSETINQMVVYHAAGLHKCVAGC